VFGYRTRLDVSEWIQRRIYLGCYEPQHTLAVKRWLRPGMTVVDVGANVGYYTALAAASVGPAGGVFAIEPGVQAFQRLNNMIASNRIEQARAFQIGFSNVQGKLKLYEVRERLKSLTGAEVDTLSAVGDPNARAFTIEMNTIDNFLDEHHVGDVDLLKLDAQGHEPQVIAGASKSLREGRIRAIVCEFYGYWLRASGQDPRALWNTLETAGFVDAERPGSAPTFTDNSNHRCFLVLRGAH